jgi:hypothetical protein
MGLSGPQGHRLTAVSPARTDPIEPRTAERRAHRRIGRYDLRHIVQARAFERVRCVRSAGAQLLPNQIRSR